MRCCFAPTGYFPLLFAAVTLVVGCTKLEIEDHSLQFNEAVGTVDNQLLLLNAVRASKDYPVRFSLIQSYTGTSRWEGTYAPDVPFPIRGDRSYKLLPSFDFNPGIQNLNLADLNTSESQAELKRTLRFNDWYYYLRSGWDIDTVNNIAIERLIIHEKIFRRLVDYMNRFCAMPRSRSRAPIRCARIEAFSRECPSGSDGRRLFGGSLREFHGENLFYFYNRPTHRCAHLAFQAALATLDVNELLVKTYNKRHAKKKPAKSLSEGSKVDKVDVNVNVAFGKPEASGSPPSHVFDFADRGTTRLVNFMLSKKDLDAKEVNPFEIDLRSPERMVRYLGEVIAAQTYAGDPRSIKVIVLTETGYAAVPLFNVVKGNLTLETAAVSVRDSEGERFSIPRPEHGSAERHRSLVALAFVQEVMSAAISRKSLPPVTNVVFSPTR